MRLMLTVGGLGFMRPASGTWGSTPPPALALALVWLVGRDGLSAADAWLVDGALVLIAIVFSVACVAGGRWAEREWGRKDPGQVVADETAGQAVALLALPWRPMTDLDGLGANVAIAATAFLAFRLLDIVKPPPANALQRLPHGWGILVDDLVAGAYALAVTQVVWRVVV
jgi:phosphatidylglycerophosphatase A